MLRDVLAAGDFVVTAELGAPLNPDPELVRQKARALAGHVHAANVTDNQAATVKLSPLACSVWTQETGLEPVMQLTTRDRNVMALQSDLLGAWALGVRAVLALGGDPLKVGPYESLATPVSDLDSLGLVRLIVGLNEGRLAAGETLESPTAFLVAQRREPARRHGRAAGAEARRRDGLLPDEHRLRRRPLRGVVCAGGRSGSP